MNYLENVYVFAKSWLEKFRVNTNQFKLFLSDNFYDECDMLGFRMDNAEFFTKYGFADSDYLELAKIIEKVSDIQLLGSAIFARWHYFKSSTDEAAILKVENRIWFVLALGRLTDLTKKKPNAFPQGIKQMRLTTNLISFGMRPNEGDEIEQQLMIDENGNVTFTGYNYHRSAIDYEKGRSKSEKIEANKAQNLLKVVSNYFFNECMTKDVTDTGCWRLELLGTDNTTYYFKGLLKPSYQVNNADLSEMVRATVQMPYLYVFSTCPQPEKIMQIRFNYWKTDILGTCREKLLIDRATKTFSYNQFLPNGNEIKQSYVLKTSVANFLDSLDSAELLCEGEEESEGEINYELTITYDEAPSLEFAGHFDFDGLPDDYPDFASKLLHFITLHSKGQILEPDDFEYELADTDSYVYCSVKLERGGRSYYYISDDNKVSLGDQVIVPVGDDNHHLRGEVVKIGVYSAADVPLPVDETKHIVRNLDEE